MSQVFETRQLTQSTAIADKTTGTHASANPTVDTVGVGVGTYARALHETLLALESAGTAAITHEPINAHQAAHTAVEAIASEIHAGASAFYETRLAVELARAAAITHKTIFARHTTRTTVKAIPCRVNANPIAYLKPWLTRCSTSPLAIAEIAFWACISTTAAVFSISSDIYTCAFTGALRGNTERDTRSFFTRPSLRTNHLSAHPTER